METQQNIIDLQAIREMEETDTWVRKCKDESSPDYANKVRYYSEQLASENMNLVRAQDKVASVTGRALGYWKGELRRAEGAVARCQAKLNQYRNMMNHGAAVVC